MRKMGMGKKTIEHDLYVGMSIPQSQLFRGERVLFFLESTRFDGTFGTS